MLEAFYSFLSELHETFFCFLNCFFPVEVSFAEEFISVANHLLLHGFRQEILMDKKRGYKILRNTPFGCNLTFDIAKAAIEGENLGRNTDTDLLTISCSSTDYIGHQVGVNAIETEDCYLRLDKALADFFVYLDQTVGKGNYLTFLTADHGGVNNATFLQDQRIPAGIWNKKGLVDELNKSLKTKFNTDKDLVKTIMNYQVFLGWVHVVNLLQFSAPTGILVNFIYIKMCTTLLDKLVSKVNQGMI